MFVSKIMFRFTTGIIFILSQIISNKLTIGNQPGGVHRRFEYKYSFKPPYLAQKDGSVPFWEYGGNVIASSEMVRIVPSLRSQKGAIWSKNPVSFNWWEVELVFRIHGRGRLGADGLAFWYVAQKGGNNGTVFGSSDKWNGLGIFFDSFDNDGKHNNPYIMAVLNDGSREFDHQNDGQTQLLSGCLRDFRNKPFPTKAKIEYYQNILTVLYHNGNTNNENDYEMCLRAEGVVLPPGGYFGMSAATGGLADDHDVLKFLTTSLSTGQQSDDKGLPAEESMKLTKEYEKYQTKLEQTKEEYKKEHPDEQTKEEDFDNWFESDNQRELRQIWQAQSATNEMLREISRKIDEVIGRQERTLSLVSSQPQTAIPVGSAVPGQGGTVQVTGTITRPEVDMLFNNHNVLVNTVHELRNIVSDLHIKTDSVINNQARAPTAHVQAAGYDMHGIVSEMRDGLNNVKQGLSHVTQKFTGAPPGCPTQNCLSLTAFLIVMGAQILTLILYNVYKSRSEAQAKKFY